MSTASPLFSRRRRAALRVALREFHVTLLLLFLLVAPIVYYFKIGGLAAFGLAVVLQYLHEFVRVYNKAYDDLSALSEEKMAEHAPAHRASSVPYDSYTHEPRRAHRQSSRLLQHVLGGAKWVAVAVFVIWVFLSVAIYIYR